jgi:hypothetical protein
LNHILHKNGMGKPRMQPNVSLRPLSRHFARLRPRRLSTPEQCQAHSLVAARSSASQDSQSADCLVARRPARRRTLSDTCGMLPAALFAAVWPSDCAGTLHSRSSGRLNAARDSQTHFFGRHRSSNQTALWLSAWNVRSNRMASRANLSPTKRASRMFAASGSRDFS